MKKKEKSLRIISIMVILLSALAFVLKFSGPNILRYYIQAGIGDCQDTPILCIAPEGEIIRPDINKEYTAELLPYKFPGIEISIPKGFTVVKEKVKKVYYKKKQHQDSGAIIYLLHEEPGFFIDLFPQLKKQGIKDNREFIRRTMYARLKVIENLTDAFFVIMKGIFIPDLGDQNNVKMAQFSIADKTGFINYNLAQSGHYFDCDIINRQGDFFKVYIKDKGATLDLDKVLAIISTVSKVNISADDHK